MAIARYGAVVRDAGLLERPEEASKLGLRAGETVTVSLNERSVNSGDGLQPNERGLAAMREIAERQAGSRCTDGSNSLALLREARAGAMYDDDPDDPTE